MANGKFVWRDLFSSDVAASKTFYKELFGWTYEEVDMGGMVYTMFGFPSDNFGGIVSNDESNGTPPHWTSYLTVDDVDAATEKAKGLGATVYFGPDDIPGVGRFTMLGDPQGASINLYKPTSLEESEPPMPTPIGGVSWNELQTTDPNAAMEFYGKLVDWSYDKTMSGSGMDYWIAKQGAAYRSGTMPKPPMVPVSSWFIYFAVADIDASVAKIKELGGAVFCDVIPVEGIGKIVYAADTTGAAFAIIQEAM